MTAQHKKLAAAIFLLFLFLFGWGFFRTFTLPQPEPFPIPVSFSGSREDYGKSARTANNLADVGLTQTSLPKALDQDDINQIEVFEKTAKLSSGTTSFAEDEARIRRAITEHKAVIFKENSTGITPGRSLALGIGVSPARFDSLSQTLAQIGRLGAMNVQQEDRTREFRRLHAQRQSLRKHQDAILKLRSTDKLSVEEALKLEQRVMEKEKEIQAVGIQLGDLLGKEPSYNLFVELQEHLPGSNLDRSFTLPRRLESALIWAIGRWMLATAGIGLLVATFLSLKVLWPLRREKAA